jgi:hypothetical protein
VIGKDGESANIDCEDAVEELHALDDPCFAMREIPLRNGIIAV